MGKAHVPSPSMERSVDATSGGRGPVRARPGKWGAVVGAVASLAGAANYLFVPQLDRFVPLPIFGLARLAALAGIYAVLPALVGLAVIVHLRTKRVSFSSSGTRVQCALLSIAAFGVGGAGAAFAFDAARERALNAAIAWCDGLRPGLELHRERHGTYPRKLGQVARERERPFLVRTGDVRYRGLEASFEIEINTSRGLAFHGARFESATGVWVR